VESLKLKFQTVAEKTSKNFTGATLFCRTWYIKNDGSQKNTKKLHHTHKYKILIKF